MCPSLLALQLAFTSAEHLANVLAEPQLQPPRKSTATSLFAGEETGLEEERRPIWGDPAGKQGLKILIQACLISDSKTTGLQDLPT